MTSRDVLQVRLENVESGQTYDFVCNDWVVIDSQHDGWLELPLQNPNDQLPVYKYRIRVQTSDVSYAGTDADVYVKLCGERGDTGKRHLKASLKNKLNKFEKGGTERFEIDAVDLGRVERVVVGHNAEGFGAGWHLHSIVVRNMDDESSKRYKFPADRCANVDQPQCTPALSYVFHSTPQSSQVAGQGRGRWQARVRAASCRGGASRHSRADRNQVERHDSKRKYEAQRRRWRRWRHGPPV